MSDLFSDGEYVELPPEDIFTNCAAWLPVIDAAFAHLAATNKILATDTEIDLAEINLLSWLYDIVELNLCTNGIVENLVEFAIAKYVLPANTGAAALVAHIWNNIPLNVLNAQGTWATLLGGSTNVQLDSGIYFAYMSCHVNFNSTFALRAYNSTASEPLCDAKYIAPQTSIFSQHFTNSAVFTLALQSTVTLQLYGSNPTFGGAASFTSQNFADIVIARLGDAT